MERSGGDAQLEQEAAAKEAAEGAVAPAGEGVMGGRRRRRQRGLWPLQVGGCSWWLLVSGALAGRGDECSLSPRSNPSPEPHPQTVTLNFTLPHP